nr:type II toxin-antitoxin system HicB family antitoxin [uncultured Draconibacterium sp.]
MVVQVLVRPNKDGWWAEVVDLPGCYSQGDTLEELKENLNEAIDLHIEGLIEIGEAQDVDDRFITEELEYDIKVIVDELFNDLPVPVTEVAKRAGINRSLLAQYKAGRPMSEDQARKIFTVIKQVGEELSALPL